MSERSVYFLLLTVIGPALSVSSIKLLVCPPTTEISPCSCFNYTNELGVTCSGPSITQSIIESRLQLLRSYEPPGSRLYLGAFDISGTSISTLDLTPFTVADLQLLSIYGNTELSAITGPPYYTIGGIPRLSIQSNSKLTDAGLGNLLKYFVPSSLREVLFYNNQISGSPMFGQFFPGLHGLNQVYSLYVGNEKTTKISDAPFYYNTKLRFLFLENNQINEIGNNAFLFDEFSTEVSTLTIYLGFNNLTSNSFHFNHKLDAISTGVRLIVRNNQIDALDSYVFEPFLLKTRNTLDVTGNPIICNGRAKWLKDRKDFYESRVYNARCINDPGNTVFNSTLIP